MSFSAIRDQVKTTLSGVSGIGQVHDYRRHTIFWTDFYARHVNNMQVNNWEITRLKNMTSIAAISNSAGLLPYYHYAHQIQILGHMSLKDEDATEKTFQDLVDGVLDALRQNYSLSGLLIFPMKFNAPVIKAEKFGGVLVHYTEISVEATERVGG